MWHSQPAVTTVWHRCSAPTAPMRAAQRLGPRPPCTRASDPRRRAGDSFTAGFLAAGHHRLCTRRGPAHRRGLASLPPRRSPRGGVAPRSASLGQAERESTHSSHRAPTQPKERSQSASSPMTASLMTHHQSACQCNEQHPPLPTRTAARRPSVRSLSGCPKHLKSPPIQKKISQAAPSQRSRPSPTTTPPLLSTARSRLHANQHNASDVSGHTDKAGDRATDATSQPHNDRRTR